MKLGYEFVWHLGDIGYADDSFDHTPVSFSHESVYDGWMSWMESLMSTKPYMVDLDSG